MNDKIIIGLTGQTGAGKSTAAKFLKSRGFYIIDADACAREVVMPQSECLNRVTQAFGSDILLKDGSLDRKKLGNIVFSDKNKLEKLSSIMNTYILKNIEEKISASTDRVIILDAPTLFESGADRLCKATISFISDSAVRKKRIINRDSISELQAQNRINSQNDDEFYIAKSDYIIRNNSDKIDLQNNTDSVINSIIKGL